MSEFDIKAAGWDSNPMHYERSKAVAAFIRKLIPLNASMTALEVGAGTGNTSILLSDSLRKITMMDNSTAMVEMMNEKIRKGGLKNLEAVYFDLEKDEYDGGRFDLIYTQMVLHHIHDTEKIIKIFSELLNPGGYLAIADLYREDGSFHGEGSHVHKGFDPDQLAEKLKKYNLINPVHMPCFTVEKEVAGFGRKNFDIFIIVAQLGKVKV